MKNIMPCHIDRAVGSIGFSYERIRGIVARALKKVNNPSAFIIVHFVGDRRIRTLNRVYRGIDRETDVLSFSMTEGIRISGGREKEWGDIFLSVPFIKKQAHRFGVSFEEECERLLIHGILHLAGFDHNVPRRARQMFKIQEDLVKNRNL